MGVKFSINGKFTDAQHNMYNKGLKALFKLKTNDTETINEILTPIIENSKADHHKEALDLISKLNG